MDLEKKEGFETVSLYTFEDSELSDKLIENTLLPDLERWWSNFSLDGCTDYAFNTEGDPYKTFCIAFTSSHYQEATETFKKAIEKEANITGRLSIRTHQFFHKQELNCPCCKTKAIYYLRARVCSYKQRGLEPYIFS